MGSSKHNDKLEQWVMHRAFKGEVLGSILGRKKLKKIFSMFNCLLCID